MSTRGDNGLMGTLTFLNRGDDGLSNLPFSVLGDCAGLGRLVGNDPLLSTRPRLIVVEANPLTFWVAVGGGGGDGDIIGLVPDREIDVWLVILPLLNGDDDRRVECLLGDLISLSFSSLLLSTPCPSTSTVTMGPMVSDEKESLSWLADGLFGMAIGGRTSREMIPSLARRPGS